MKVVTFPAVELVGDKRNAPLSRFPAPRFLSCEITCAQSTRGILTAPIWTSELTWSASESMMHNRVSLAALGFEPEEAGAGEQALELLEVLIITTW